MRPSRYLTFAAAWITVAANSSLADTLLDRDWESIWEAAQLAREAYHDDPSDRPIGSDGNGYWRKVDEGSTSSGLKWKLFERVRPDGVVERTLAFSGTDPLDPQDWGTNLAQLGSVSVPQQYKEALGVAQRFLEESKGNPVLWSATGHSLGGGLAQHVSRHTGIRAYTFDAAPLGVSTALGEVERPWGDWGKQRSKLAESMVINLRLIGDPVSASPGKIHGKLISLVPAPGTPAGLIARHDLDALIAALTHYRNQKEALDRAAGEARVARDTNGYESGSPRGQANGKSVPEIGGVLIDPEINMKSR